MPVGAYMALKATKQLEAVPQPGLSVPVAKVNQIIAG